eukprot:4591104-Pyramimonas_sp.AAC.1
MSFWIRYFGLPEMIICDGGPEFQAEVERGAEHHGVRQGVVHCDSPWENGRAERHGGWVKELLLKGMEDQVVASVQALE